MVYNESAKHAIVPKPWNSIDTPSKFDENSHTTHIIAKQAGEEFEIHQGRETVGMRAKTATAHNIDTDSTTKTITRKQKTWSPRAQTGTEKPKQTQGPRKSKIDQSNRPKKGRGTTGTRAKQPQGPRKTIPS